jgi:hypothetical protein
MSFDSSSNNFTDGEETSPIAARRNRLRLRLSRLEQDKEKFNQAADQLSEAAYEQEQSVSGEDGYDLTTEDELEQPALLAGVKGRSDHWRSLNGNQSDLSFGLAEDQRDLNNDDSSNYRLSQEVKRDERRVGKEKLLRKELSLAKLASERKDKNILETHSRMKIMERKLEILDQELRDLRHLLVRAKTSSHTEKRTRPPSSVVTNQKSAWSQASGDDVWREAHVVPTIDVVSRASDRFMIDSDAVEQHFRAVAESPAKSLESSLSGKKKPHGFSDEDRRLFREVIL